jgi:hypothetical protein
MRTRWGCEGWGTGRGARGAGGGVARTGFGQRRGPGSAALRNDSGSFFRNLSAPRPRVCGAPPHTRRRPAPALVACSVHSPNERGRAATGGGGAASRCGSRPVRVPAPPHSQVRRPVLLLQLGQNLRRDQGKAGGARRWVQLNEVVLDLHGMGKCGHDAAGGRPVSGVGRRSVWPRVKPGWGGGGGGNPRARTSSPHLRTSFWRPLMRLYVWMNCWMPCSRTAGGGEGRVAGRWTGGGDGFGQVESGGRPRGRANRHARPPTHAPYASHSSDSAHDSGVPASRNPMETAPPPSAAAGSRGPAGEQTRPVLGFAPGRTRPHAPPSPQKTPAPRTPQTSCLGVPPEASAVSSPSSPLPPTREPWPRCQPPPAAARPRVPPPGQPPPPARAGSGTCPGSTTSTRRRRCPARCRSDRTRRRW